MVKKDPRDSSHLKTSTKNYHRKIREQIPQHRYSLSPMPIRRMIKHWWRNSLKEQVEEEHNLQFQEKNGRILTHRYTEAKKGFTGCTSCPQQRYTFSMKYSKYLSETVSK